MSESVLVNCLLKAKVLLVLVINSCVFESLSWCVCVRACVCVCECVQHIERQKSNCWHLAALKVALGFVLFTATWSFHSPPQKKPFSVSAASSHCSKVLECVWVCKCARLCCLRVECSRASFSVGKESFSTKGEGTAAMSAPLIRTGHMRGGGKRQREGGHLSVKGRGNLWCDPP